MAQKRAYYIHEAMLPISIGFCSSAKQFKAEMKALKMSDYDWEWLGAGKGGTAHLFKSDSGHRTTIMCIDPKDEKTINQLVGLVAHESVHMLQYAVLAMGEEKVGDEFAAYLVQYVSQQAMFYFAKKHKFKKP